MNNLLAFIVFYPMVGALISLLIGFKNEKARDYFADFIVISEFAITLLIAFSAELNLYIPEVCGMGLHFTKDGFRGVYASIAALMWMMTTILSREYFSHHENRNRFYLFLLLTLGATMGVFLSSDLFTTFIFFEIMSFTSYVWVAQEETKDALKAALTYLAVAVMGGLVMLMGLFMIHHALGTLTMSELLPLASAYPNKTYLLVAGICLLFGFGAKAGAFPLHIWLPKAHPVAPAPASALLSGILTKTGIFGILVVTSNIFLHDPTWGMLILVLGTITMFCGAFLALFSIDLKRTLACSSMSQIGFIMVGIGMQCLLGHHNELAVHGTMLHMINHSLIKLVLFMAAGVIYMNTHALNLNKIKGFGRKKPLLMVIFLIGACAIGGIPLFSGYISKTLLHESIVHYGASLFMTTIEWIFLCSGGLTVAYMTKLFVAIFIEENSDAALQKKYDEKKKFMNLESSFALVTSALILFIWGLFPHQLMDQVAIIGQDFMHLYEAGHAVHYFAWINLKGGLISIGIGALIYLLIVRRKLIKDGEYVNLWPTWFDVEDHMYKPILLGVLPLIARIVCRFFDSLVDLIVVALRKTIFKDSPLPHELVEGNFLSTILGKIANGIQFIANLTIRRKDPDNTDYVHKYALFSLKVYEERFIITRSLSFGLLLVCIGLCITLVYIIFI